MQHHSSIGNQQHFTQFNRGFPLQRSTFNRDSFVRTTINAGYTVPVWWDSVIPGDTFNMVIDSFARMTTPLNPIFDNLYCDVDLFFVPSRLCWDNFRKFCGEKNPGDNTEYVYPSFQVPTVGFPNFSLFDYLGLPTNVPNSGSSNQMRLNEMPVRAAALCWNAFYRDENFQQPITVSTGNNGSLDPLTDFSMSKFRRGKRKDRFTSALPWPSKDGIDAFAEVRRVSLAPQWLAYRANTNNNAASGGDVVLDTSTPRGLSDSTGPISLDPNGGLGVSMGYITDAMALWRLLELQARAGTRYTEVLFSQFGVSNPDLSYRPELLFQSTTPVNFVPVAQTSETDTSAQGNLSAFATFRHSPKRCVKSFSEHGYLILFMSVRADLTYQQGVEREWTRETYFDVYNPMLANITEQAIRNDEIYYRDITAGTNELPFGFAEAWSEYRMKESRVTGALRSEYSQSLDAWHLSQDFASLPTLNSDFIVENPPMDRILATPGQWMQQFMCEVSVQNKTTRVMPVYSIPGAGGIL